MVRKLLFIIAVFLPFAQYAQCFPVKGKAVKEDGKTPAAGIVVQATHMRDSVPGKKDDFLLKGKTEADGTFSIELPPLEDMYNVCLLDTEGHYYWGQAHVNGNVDLGTIKLERGCELSGKVRTKDGKPLANVEIQLKLKLKVCTHHVDAAKTTSGADGKFIFPDLSPGEYTYQSKGGAYSVKPGTINVTEDPSYLELALEKAATIKGVVKDDQGKPVAGIRVSAETASTETDSEGKYVLGGMPIGSFYVSARGNGYVQKDDGGDRQVKCEAGKEVQKDFTVIKSGSLSLQVELADKSETLPKQLTVAFGRKTGRNSSTSTSSPAELKNGTAVFKELVPADYTVTVKKGAGTWLATNQTIVAGQEAKLSVVLPHVLEIKGKVVDEKGKAVQGATVRASVQKEKSDENSANRFNFYRGEQQYLSTDKDGKFTLEGLAEGSKMKIAVSYQNLMPTNRVVVVKKEHPAEDFILGKGLTISGSVLESDGKPAQGIEVHLSVPYSTTGNSAERYEMMSSMSRNMKVDDKGGFELSGLLPGKYDLNFYKSDNDMREVETNLRGVEAGTDDVIVSLGKKQTVTGKVTDKEGKPLAKVNIDVTKAQDGRSYARYSRGDKAGKQTGVDGTFSLVLRGGSKYSLGFYLYPYVQKTVTIDLGAGAQTPAPVKMELERGYKVIGTVVDSKEKPVAGVKINASSQGNMFGNMFMPEEADEDEADDKPGKNTNTKGEFALDGVSPGVVNLVVSIKTNNMARNLASKEIVVSRDKPNDVKVVLPGMGTVKGRLVNAEGKSVAESTVSLYSPKGGSSMAEQTDENGKFTIENVPAGSYMAMWYGGSSGTGVRPVTVVVKKGEVSEIILGTDQPKANAMTISGVAKKEGKPLGKGTIMLSPMPKEDADEMELASMYGSYARGVLDSSGSFVVSNVTAGTYFYRITRNQAAKTSADDEEEGAVSYFSGDVAIAAGQAKVEINITGLTMTGTVSGSDGKPVSKCRVILTPASAKSTMKWMLARYGVTDTQGKYKLECVPAGKYDMTINAEAQGSGGLKNIELTDSTRQFDVKLGPAFKLSGKITMDGGESLQGATVVATSEDEMGGGWAQVTDTGEYEMEPKLPKGKYMVFFNRQGYAIESAALDINSDTKHDVKLVVGGHLQVMVTSAGKPVKGQVIRLKTEKGEEVLRQRGKQFVGAAAPWYIGPTDEEGKTTFRGLKPGKYVISTDGNKATVSAEINPVETTEVELKL